MIHHVSLILALQLIGEITARSFGLLIPGPVIGMVLFLIVLIAFPEFATRIRTTAMAILAHLSLLFVPAGVGIIAHVQSLGTDAILLLGVVLVSTILSILAGAASFTLICRLMGRSND